MDRSLARVENETLLVGHLSSDRNNNLDSIRFLAATLVIFSHAFPLSGDSYSEPFLLATSSQMSFGSLGVAIFFVISGFLISQSYERSSSIVSYFKSRFLRIFPGLFVAVLFCSFIIGPLVTTLSLKEYFSNGQTYEYVKTIFLYPVYWYLPGVFETNAWKGGVNGSLWTIPFEVLCYVSVAILGLLGVLKKGLAVFLLFAVVFYLRIYGDHTPFINGKYILDLEVKTLIELSTYFIAGMLMYCYRNSIFINKHLAMISISMLCLAALYGGFKESFILFGSYLIIYFAFNPNITFHFFSKYGDFSYGLYIYAFPIQQVVTYYYGGKMNPFMNFFLSFLVTFLLAIFSWHLIEKGALNLKKRKFSTFFGK